MNVNYTLHGIEFEWDSHKATSNLRRRRISFETACEVFHDPFVMVVNEEDVEGELRETVIGMTIDWRLLYVVYVMREDVVRIISARVVTATERKRYEEQ
jgi:uncharacterized DUF497 family protein